MNSATQPPTSITVQGGTKRYGENTVFENISVAFQPGTYTTLTGPNGSGKSTLLSCILGQELFTEGKLFLGDQEVLPGNTQYAQQVFGINDSIGWLPGLTVGQHLELLHRNSAHIPQQTATELLSPQDALDQLDVPQAWDREPYSLSSGQEQRARLASLLIRDATYFFLDEPEKRLDTDGVQWVAQWSQQRVNAGAMVCIATHDATLNSLNSTNNLRFPLDARSSAEPLTEHAHQARQ